MLKSLLTSCAIFAASVAAMAAPTVTVTNPVPGSTLDNKQYFDTFNLSASGSYTVADGAKATLECLETGDMLNSTTFKDFMGMAIIVNFDSNDIVDNGEYELVIPAGSLLVDGEPCEKLTATYVLNDPDLASGGSFPQITLVSSNPASGSGVAAIGAEALNKVTFVTSDDAAVNYIGWELWDVTNPDAPEWIYQGSENRIDPNRNDGKLDDMWTNGLYITIGGPDQKLIKGQKYEMKLTFCGIGYNPDTNQYPNSISIEKSKELETSIFFEGLTPGTEYSPYVYESVSPDESIYEIETVEQAMFTVTYSGEVRPFSFIYHRAQGDTPEAGHFNPLNDENGDGYATIWEFVVYPSIAKNMTGEASFYIVTKDMDGLTLKGNGGYPTDDFTYRVTYETTIGYPDLVSVAPEAGATLQSLSEIVVGNSDDLVMAYSWNATEPARICDMHGAQIRTLGVPEAVGGNSKQMKWTFDPITTSGNYVLIIPKWYFALGEEFDGSTNKVTTFAYIVDNGEAPSGATFDLVPASVTPADGSTVSEISNVVLTFSDTTFYPMSIGAPVATLVNTSSVAEVIYTSEPAIDNDWFNPTEYTFTFSTPIKEKGTYKFTVAKGAFCDETYDMEMGEAGHASDELVYTFIIGEGSGVESVEAVAANGNVYSVDGKVVLRNASEADVNALPAGIYIFNGKKLVVK
ncbi:MAG: hypothetical protein NC095_01520 [Muribaculum sp.]|nr:hypothetical protein [Muribaculum sp.]